MSEFHDDIWKGKGSKEKDNGNDIDININVSVDKDGETCFGKSDRNIGSAAAAGAISLNLCDVARGISDVKSTLDDGRLRDFDGPRDDDWGGRGSAGGHRGHGRVEGHIGDAIDFKPQKGRNEEPGFIDCEWGRLLEANKVDMLQRYAKLGASLKGNAG